MFCEIAYLGLGHYLVFAIVCRWILGGFGSHNGIHRIPSKTNGLCTNRWYRPNGSSNGIHVKRIVFEKRKQLDPKLGSTGSHPKPMASAQTNCISQTDPTMGSSGSHAKCLVSLRGSDWIPQWDPQDPIKNQWLLHKQMV